MTERSRQKNNKCDCSIFKPRIEGKVPCVSLGKSYLDNCLDIEGEITGICFQKVDEGKVKPVIDADELFKVDWQRVPRTSAVPHQYLELDYQIVPSEKWQIFANVVANLRTALLVQMTPQNDVAPTTLYDGFHSNVWRGGGNDDKRTSAHLYSRIADILSNVRQAREMNPLELQTILHCMLEGFKVMGEHMIQIFIDNILNITVFGETETVRPPVKGSYDNSIDNGVLHCLVYGNHEDQLEIEDGHSQNGRNRSRIRHKVLCPKICTERFLSRSCSPSPGENNVLAEIENTQNRDPDQVINMVCLVQHPSNYLVKSSCLQNYVQSYIPDLVFLRNTIGGRVAKIVVEISAFDKYGSYISFETHLKQSTEQCFQKCLAGLSNNQKEIAGLVVVPDGMKLMVVHRVKKTDNMFSYEVKETELVIWNETNKLFAIMLKLIDCS
ncbi:uncharacterized protein LOC127699823 [Mytilus californianus]|uniref:uncharacterized protein LOC127699823 n=1 Tax=Mytilus californianus TaxID=6549 RepID=UPI0022466F36|nr:uncharacterized protein LOC127699823 [Mytilus californianus]